VRLALLVAALISSPVAVRAQVKAKPALKAAKGATAPATAVDADKGAGRAPWGPASDLEAGGTHLRVVTANGPVHLFKPPGFDRRTAGVVVYVHGYYTRVDEAWREHKLAEQFVASRRNALFVAPEAPTEQAEEPSWLSLHKLLATTFKAARMTAPPGPLVVVGHSGAYRTLARWLDEPGLHQLILVDALYGNERDFADWLARDRSNRMTLIVKGTAKWADPFVKKLPYAVTVPQIPSSIYELSREERNAKLLCVRSQYGHFELITEGRTLPVMLVRTGLRPVPGVGNARNRGPRKS
jgi:hypothetical protein